MQVKALFIRKKHSSPNIADCRRVVTCVPNSPAWWVMIRVQNSPAWWVLVSVKNPQRSRKQDSSATQRTHGKTRENTRRTGTGNDTGKLQQRSDNTRRKTRRYIDWLMEYSWRWWENQVISGNAHMKQSVHTHTHTHKTRKKQRINKPWQYPPLLGTPPGVPRQTYLPIVIIDKGVIQDVPSRYPTSLLRTVTFPVHQVLESASPPSRVQNTVDRICRFPIYESRRWGNRDRRINVWMKHGFNLGNMKGGVNSPVRRRKFESDCHRTNDFSDRERANKFGS